MVECKLSAEQIKNWRKVLSIRFGPYAFIMPDSEVQKLRDSHQKLLDEKAEGAI